MEAVNKVRLFRMATWLDENTFEEIFLAHYPQVYAVLFRLTGDRAEADDLAAETFWKLWDRPPGRMDNLAGWLYRVATRIGYNALRANRRRKQYEEEAAASEFVLPRTGDTAHEAERRLERARVRAVLRQMPVRDVQVLVLRYSGLSYQEIADALAVRSNAVGTMLSRAETRFEALYRRGESHAPEG